MVEAKNNRFKREKRASLDGQVFPFFHVSRRHLDPDGLDGGQALANLPLERVLFEVDGLERPASYHRLDVHVWKEKG